MHTAQLCQGGEKLGEPGDTGDTALSSQAEVPAWESKEEPGQESLAHTLRKQTPEKEKTLLITGKQLLK